MTFLLFLVFFLSFSLLVARLPDDGRTPNVRPSSAQVSSKGKSHLCLSCMSPSLPTLPSFLDYSMPLRCCCCCCAVAVALYLFIDLMLLLRFSLHPFSFPIMSLFFHVLRVQTNRQAEPENAPAIPPSTPPVCPAVLLLLLILHACPSSSPFCPRSTSHAKIEERTTATTHKKNERKAVVVLFQLLYRSALTQKAPRRTKQQSSPRGGSSPTPTACQQER